MKKLFFCMLSLFSLQAYAVFCPNNMNQVNIGDTQEQVALACGKPTAEKAYKDEPFVPQEWNYYIRMDANMQGTIRMIITFDANQKVINMSVNSSGVTYTGICGTAITLNNTPKQIEAACGKPFSITKSDNGAKPIDMMEYTYDGMPSATFVFKDGLLTETK